MQDVVTKAWKAGDHFKVTLSGLEFKVNPRGQISNTHPAPPSLSFLPSTNSCLLYYYITKTTILRGKVRLDHGQLEILKNCQT